MAVDRKQQLAVGEQQRYFIRQLIADTLRYTLIDGRAFATLAIWSFRFDDHQRNTIHKAHNIRPAGVHPTAAGDGIFLGKRVVVVGRVVPVNQCNGWIGSFAIDKLSYRDTVQQVVVQFFIGTH